MRCLANLIKNYKANKSVKHKKKVNKRLMKHARMYHRKYGYSEGLDESVRQKKFKAYQTPGVDEALFRHK